jgi:acyl-CoA thioester hydrolase
MTLHEALPQPASLRPFPVTVELAVAWGDMDAFGHVNNTVYFRYFEHVRLRYFERVGFALNRDPIGPILKSIGCRFRLPLSYPDSVTAAARVSEIGTDRITMDYAVYSHRHQRIAAEGQSVIVSYDYRAGAKCELPRELLESMRAIERTRD